MRRFKKVMMFVASFLCGWQIGVFACSYVNPNVQGSCQFPPCRNYSQICPSGWTVSMVGSWHRCCKQYTGSHVNPSCCEWAQRSYSYVDPGCRAFQCVTGSPPNQQRVWHCERKYATPYGNWQNVYSCESLGNYQNCSELNGYCRPLEQ